MGKAGFLGQAGCGLIDAGQTHFRSFGWQVKVRHGDCGSRTPRLSVTFPSTDRGSLR
jgi:hypothetical protein